MQNCNLVDIKITIFQSGCPVIGGEKWIFTKLINERGQEWIRPCAMDNGEDEVKKLIGG